VNDPVLRSQLTEFLREDDFNRNLFYQNSLPHDLVEGQLKIKSSGVLSGLPIFREVFRLIDPHAVIPEEILEWEGKKVDPFEIKFSLPFSTALAGERLALNLLQRMSAISTFTSGLVEKAAPKGIKILDTRKTTPGLRGFEKYAVRQGGGFNHRFGQTDLWMIKDNHKNFFGGLKPAFEFFREKQTAYNFILAEIHDEKEFELAKELGISFVMLDNFSPEQIKKVIDSKPEGMHVELSGGITLETIDNFLIEGVDAISVGSLTYAAPAFDASFKYYRP
jgi:nicotinate-nucleotide pyrophosphorylase (carboxylating)